MKFKRNQSAVEMLNTQKDLYEQYLNPKHAAKAKASLENVTQLPSGHVIKQATSNTGRNDIVNLHKLMQEEICASFGVPRSMMFADGSGNRSHDTVGTHQTFMHTLLWWKRKLSSVLSDTYNAIHADNITNTISITNTDNLDELKKKYKMNIFFPVTPFVDNDQLRKLYGQGFISWKAYGEYALRNISLPLEDLQPKAPAIDKLLFEMPEKKEKGEKRKAGKEVKGKEGEVKEVGKKGGEKKEGEKQKENTKKRKLKP